MAYKKTIFKDTLRDAAGNVIQKGTPLNAEVLGKIEDGIVAAEQKVDTEIEKVTTQLAQKVEIVEFNALSDFLGVTNLFEPPLASNEWVTDSSGRALNMSSDEFLDLFYNPYVGTHENGYRVFKYNKGKDESGLYDVYSYDFYPQNYTREIILTSGMHTYELSAHFGLAHFIEHLMTMYDTHPAIRYIRDNVRIKVIPIINPWGWNQSPKKYGNVNGVNINRNFDYNGVWATFPNYTPAQNEWNVKGSAPFSEAETRILRDWVLSNNNAEFWIDCHTGLNIGPYDNFIYHLSTSPLVPKINTTLDMLEERIKRKYGKSNPSKEVVIDSEGSIRHQWSQHVAGVPTMTLEQTPNNPLWGTALNNEAGDITEFEVTLWAYLFNFLYFNEDGFVPKVENSIEKIERLEKALESILKAEFTVISDTFDDKPNGNLTGKVTTVGEKAWKVDPLYTGTTLMVINNGAVKANTANVGHALLDAGLTDCELSCDIKWDTYAGLFIRTGSSIGTNYIMARINSTGLGLFENRGSSETLGNYAFTPVKNQNYNLKLRVKGTSIRVYLDGILVIDTTCTIINNTHIGFRTTNDTISTFDNLKVKLI